MVSGHIYTDHLFDKREEIGVDRELAKRGLRNFIEIAWDLVEPSRPFVGNWSIDAMCDHLEAAKNLELRRLCIAVPPGTMKSLTTSVFFPAWSWTQNPEKKFITASYADIVARRDSLRARRLIKSDWYQGRWGENFSIYKDADTSFLYRNDKGGFRFAVTVRGSVTGEHADIQLVDDPVKPLDVTKSMHIEKGVLVDCLDWWNETMSSRLVDLENSVRIVVMQRLHELDLIGAMQEQGYEMLVLPMEYETKRKCSTSIGFEDPRTEEGELLFPQRFPKTSVEEKKVELGPHGYGAQYQQNPKPKGGNIIKEKWARIYTELPSRFDLVIQSWDCTFKGGLKTDFVTGLVWGMVGSDYYLFPKKFHKQCGFVATCAGVKRLSVDYPEALQKLIEAKANGEAVVDALKRAVPGFKLINPEGGKEARLHAVEHLWEGGNVWIPSKELAPWVWEVDGYMDELTGFPSKAHDDYVDATSQALVWLEKKTIAKLKQAMRNVRIR